MPEGVGKTIPDPGCDQTHKTHTFQTRGPELFPPTLYHLLSGAETAPGGTHLGTSRHLEDAGAYLGVREGTGGGASRGFGFSGCEKQPLNPNSPASDPASSPSS